MKQIFRPAKNFIAVGLCLLVVLLAAPPEARAQATKAQKTEDQTSQLCVDETTRLEQSEGIPEHLLTAISLAETGRWQKGTRENIAWPWTVTAHGRGQHFESKQQALLEVEVLMTEGVRNIDVGCMQINLLYHEDAFASLSEALDPKANTTYAARFLKRLYEETNDWMDAAGAYHSSTPQYNLKYRAKLARIWNRNPEITAQTDAAVESQRASVENGISQSAASENLEYRQISDLNSKLFGGGDESDAAPAPGGRFLQAAMRRHDEMIRGLDERHMAVLRLAEQRLR